MHYTALHNYSAVAGIPPAPAQRAPAMASFTAISAASGELMVPENAGVVIQAKSGINAIRVSGTATTTAGVTGPGTTSNQIQFYSNDTIVGAFDQLGLYTTGAVYTNSIKTTADTDLLISSYFGTSARAIQFKGMSWNNSALEGRYGFCSASGWSFEDGGTSPVNLFTISKDGIIANRSLTTNGNIYASVGVNEQNALALTRSGAGQAFGVGIDFRLTSSSTNSYARVYGGWVNGVSSENSRGYIALDVNNNGGYAGNPLNALIYGDVNRGVLINSGLWTRSITCSAGNSLYFNNPADTYSWSFKTDAANKLHLVNQYGTDYITLSDAQGISCLQNLNTTNIIGSGSITAGSTVTANSLVINSGGSGWNWTIYQGSAGPGATAGNLHFVISGYGATHPIAGNYDDIRSYINPQGGYVVYSDERLKKSITPLTSSLTRIMNLKPVNFLYNYQSDDTTLNTGFIAQDAQKVIDNVVELSDKTNENSYLGMNTTGLIPYIVKAMQEQQEEIMDLKSQLDELKFILNKLVK